MAKVKIENGDTTIIIENDGNITIKSPVVKHTTVVESENNGYINIPKLPEGIGIGFPISEDKSGL